MEPRDTRFDRIVSRIKNNPVVAIVLVVGTIVIAIATFTDAAKSLLSLVVKETRPDLTGKWVTPVLTNPFARNDTFRFSFDFEVKGDTLLGTVRQTSTTKRYDIRDGILDGKIKSDAISFHTQKLMRLGEEEIPYRNLYSGSVSKEKIDFILHSDRRGGFPPQKFVARRE